MRRRAPARQPYVVWYLVAVVWVTGALASVAWTWWASGSGPADGLRQSLGQFGDRIVVERVHIGLFPRPTLIADNVWIGTTGADGSVPVQEVFFASDLQVELDPLRLLFGVARPTSIRVTGGRSKFRCDIWGQWPTVRGLQTIELLDVELSNDRFFRNGGGTSIAFEKLEARRSSKGGWRLFGRGDAGGLMFRLAGDAAPDGETLVVDGLAGRGRFGLKWRLTDQCRSRQFDVEVADLTLPMKFVTRIRDAMSHLNRHDKNTMILKFQGADIRLGAMRMAELSGQYRRQADAYSASISALGASGLALKAALKVTSAEQQEQQFHLEGRVENIALPFQLGSGVWPAWYAGRADMVGVLSGVLPQTLTIQSWQTLEGSVTLSPKGGRLAPRALPDAAQNALGLIAPTLNTGDRGHSLIGDVSVQLENGVITIDHARLEAGGLGVVAEGGVDMNDGSIHAEVYPDHQDGPPDPNRVPVLVVGAIESPAVLPNPGATTP